MTSSSPDHAGPDRGVEAGFIAVEWLAAMVFLLIPVVLIGAGVSRWPEHQQVARAASAEAARAAVLADDPVTARAEATRVADQVAANYGIPADRYTVRVSIPIWDWGEPVTVTVTMAMPGIDVPGVGSWGATDWSSSSTQRIEDYRGLDP